MPLPHNVRSPISVPVVPNPFFQSISRMPVVPPAPPSTSTPQTTELGSLAVSSSHSFSISTEGGLRRPRKSVASRSSNQLTIGKASSDLGGRSRTSLPWITGPYMTRKCMRGLWSRPIPHVWRQRSAWMELIPHTWRQRRVIGGPPAPESLAAGVQLRRLFDVHRHRRALRRGDVESPQVLALRGRRLVPDQCVDQRRKVLMQ